METHLYLISLREATSGEMEKPQLVVGEAAVTGFQKGSLVNRRVGNPILWQDHARAPSLIHARIPEKL